MGDHARAVMHTHEIMLKTSQTNDIRLNFDSWETLDEKYQDLHQRLFWHEAQMPSWAACSRQRYRAHDAHWVLGASEREHHNSKDIAKSCCSNCCTTLLDRSSHHFFEDLERNDDISGRPTWSTLCLPTLFSSSLALTLR